MRQGRGKFLQIVLLTCLVCLSASGYGSAQEVVAVLSSDLGPYREAFQGFQEAYGKPVPSFSLAEAGSKIGPNTRVVIAFGGKAALSSYPDHVVLIYCMAPGTKLESKDRHGSSIEIQMLPRASSILSKLKEIQPNLSRLAVLWSSKTIEDYIQEMQNVSNSMGIQLLPERLKSPDELPDRLRALYANANAVWLLPDPVLVNAESFSVLKTFSTSNKIPFYAPTAGLVEKGATASVSSSFREIGRAAAMFAREALSGKAIPDTAYPEKAEITLSIHAANSAGLQISQETLKNVDKVLP